MKQTMVRGSQALAARWRDAGNLSQAGLYHVMLANNSPMHLDTMRNSSKTLTHLPNDAVPTIA
ncbi:MAG: hypothetical protein K1Y02_09670 [Candidatus Hydrogenedentes bacterium]|nr:hypothetical protein [Candidatus Hydrogenedentota bacterium]